MSTSTVNPAAATESQYTPPPGHTQLYINNIPWSTTTQELSDFFKSNIGVEPTQVNIAVSTFKKTQGRSRGFGFVTISSDKLSAALQLSGKTLGDRELSIVEARPRDATSKPATHAKSTQQHSTGKLSKQSSEQQEHQPRTRPPRKTYDNAQQLYIRNLSWDSTVESLTKAIQSLSVTPIEVEIATRAFGKFKGSSRGFGFIYVNNNDVQKVLQLNDTDIDGRTVTVQIARTEEESEEIRKNRPPRQPRQRRTNGTENGHNENTEVPQDNRRRGRNEE